MISSRHAKQKYIQIKTYSIHLVESKKHVGGENTKQKNIQEYSRPLEILVQTHTYTGKVERNQMKTSVDSSIFFKVDDLLHLEPSSAM